MKPWVFVVLAAATKEACLPRQTLSELGFAPLAGPTAWQSSLCTSVYGNGGAQTCVDAAQFEAFAKAFQAKNNLDFHARTHALQDGIANYFTKFATLQAAMSTGQYTDSVSTAAKNAVLDAQAFVPDDVSAFNYKYTSNMGQCLRAQNKLSLGTLCLLSSSLASDYIVYKSQMPDNGVLVARRLRVSNPFVVKISAQAADEVIAECMPLARASCGYRKIGEALDIIKNRPARVSSAGCYKEAMACEDRPGLCNSKAKNLLLQSVFKPFGARVYDEAAFKDYDTILTQLGGSKIDRTRQAIANFWSKTVDATKSVGNTTSAWYSTAANSTATAYNSAVNWFTPIASTAYNSTIGRVTPIATSAYNSTVGWVAPIATNAYNSTATWVSSAWKRRRLQDAALEVEYYVAPDGRNVAIDGEASGVNPMKGEIFSYALALAFMLLQFLF